MQASLMACIDRCKKCICLCNGLHFYQTNVCKNAKHSIVFRILVSAFYLGNFLHLNIEFEKIEDKRKKNITFFYSETKKLL